MLHRVRRSRFCPFCINVESGDAPALGDTDWIPTAISVVPEPMLLLGIFRLVELDLEVARYIEVRHETVSMVLNFLRKIHASFTQLGNRAVNIIAEKGDIRSAGWRLPSFYWMNTEIRFRSVEDEPSSTDIRSVQTKLIPEERPKGLRLRRVKHRVHTTDHDGTPTE